MSATVERTQKHPAMSQVVDDALRNPSPIHQRIRSTLEQLYLAGFTAGLDRHFIECTDRQPELLDDVLVEHWNNDEGRMVVSMGYRRVSGWVQSCTDEIPIDPPPVRWQPLPKSRQP